MFGNMLSFQPDEIPQFLTRRVYFTGDTAVKEGQALVFDYASTAAGKGKAVCTPTSSKNKYFAGVAKQAYPAKTGGQHIDIYIPGSICKCLVAPATTAGTTVVVFSQTDGKFGKSTSEVGNGTALALETQASAVANGALVLCRLLEGNEAVAPVFSAS